MNKVLIASANPWSFALAVERDIIATRADRQVDVLNLFRICSSRAPEWRSRDRWIEALNRKINRFVVPLATGREITGDIALGHFDAPPLPADEAALRAYRHGEARIGLATLSSVTSITTIIRPPALEDYGPALRQAWHAAHLSAEYGRLVAERGYDEVYIFNGRHCYSRPFCDALSGHARVFRYEQGGTGTRYVMSDRGVHAPDAVADLILSHPTDEASGRVFFEQRLAKAAGNPVAFFTANQVEGLLPAGVEAGGIVSFYTSSSDEMYAVGDDPGFGDFPTQGAVGLAVAEACKTRGLRFVIRFHPHLLYKHPSWQREWDFAALRRLGAVLVLPEDPCDTYALARASRCVLTCGSTIGFEAAYLSVPVAEVGYWAAGALGAVTTVRTAAEMAAFLEAPRLAPSAQERAIRYGAYASGAGKELPSLDVGRHPDLARIDGRIVDPVRYALRKVRDLGSIREYKALPPGGKIIVDPSVLQALARKMQ